MEALQSVPPGGDKTPAKGTTTNYHFLAPIPPILLGTVWQ